jgi:hypothetical protein
MARGESHRATYRMHHFQPSGIYETGSGVFSGSSRKRRKNAASAASRGDK